MSYLKYRTKGDSSPYGKPKVYFCCHPDDFRTFFEPILKDIFDVQNCTLWYREDLSTPINEEYFSELRQMQLFVMPITRSLLYTQNNALDVDFAFAMENHIPVLPLMQDVGITERFNEKCGDLQFLDKQEKDSSAIPYEEKLKTYLNSVLVGDELAKKVRSAFDAYVFLSYRKKDRIYAQELMRLIHKNEFCRDVAIWYDEYLTPGENFNTAIQEILNKSDLFVLTVTPNIVNEKNYIMDEEYPLAKKQGKPIVAAEIVPTDHQLLASKYEGLTSSADAYDDEALSKALRDAMSAIALQTNSASPEHNFFIGLAYLSGIDVEIDYDRAVELITSAAESGIVEATEKLVDMYRTGLGLPRSYEKAMQWQERKVDLLRQSYKKAPTRICALSLWEAYRSLGDFKKERGDNYGSLKCYKEGLHHIKHARFRFKGDETLIYASVQCCSYIGQRYADINDLSAAEHWYRRSIRACRRLKKLNTSSATISLARLYRLLGELYRREYSLWESGRKYKRPFIRKLLQSAFYDNKKLGENAKRNYIRSASLLEEALKDSDFAPIRHREALAETYKSIGDIYLGRALGYSSDNVNKAKEFYKKQIDLCEGIVAEDNSAENRKILALAYANSAYRCTIDEAEIYLNKALSLQKAVVAELCTINTNLALGYIYDRMGNFYRNADKNAEALDAFDRAISIYEADPAIFSMYEAKSILCSTLYYATKVSFELKDWDKIGYYSKKYFELAEYLAEKYASPGQIYRLIEAYHIFATTEEEHSDAERKSLPLYEKLCRIRPHDERYKNMLFTVTGTRKGHKKKSKAKKQ